MSPFNNSIFEGVEKVLRNTFPVHIETIEPKLGIGDIEAWDSMGHLTLMMAIEEEFSVKFSTKQISQPKTIMDICQILSCILKNESP